MKLGDFQVVSAQREPDSGPNYDLKDSKIEFPARKVNVMLTATVSSISSKGQPKSSSLQG